MPNLDLNLLVALHALLQERSVTRAAQRLGLTQPTLSGTLARLRRHYNDELLYRAGNTYALTPLGAHLASRTGVARVSSGMYFSVDLALVADVLPDRDTAAAKNFGLFNIANQLPQTLAPATAPLFLAISFGSVGTGGPNYTAFFAACAVIAVVSAVTILPVRGVR